MKWHPDPISTHQGKLQRAATALMVMASFSMVVAVVGLFLQRSTLVPLFLGLGVGMLSAVALHLVAFLGMRDLEKRR